MNKNQVKKLVLEQVKKSGWVTYPQLLRFLSEEGVNVNGSYQLEMKDKNIVLWGGLSETVVTALTDLMQDSKIVGMPAPVELYQIDGIPTAHPLTMVVPNDALPNPAIFLTFLRYVPQPTNVTPIRQ